MADVDNFLDNFIGDFFQLSIKDILLLIKMAKKWKIDVQYDASRQELERIVAINQKFPTFLESEHRHFHVSIRRSRLCLFKSGLIDGAKYIFWPLIAPTLLSTLYGICIRHVKHAPLIDNIAKNADLRAINDDLRSINDLIERSGNQRLLQYKIHYKNILPEEGPNLIVTNIYTCINCFIMTMGCLSIVPRGLFPEPYGKQHWLFQFKLYLVFFGWWWQPSCEKSMYIFMIFSGIAAVLSLVAGVIIKFFSSNESWGHTIYSQNISVALKDENIVIR